MGLLAHDIGTFVSQLTYRDLPTGATPAIRNGFADFVATVLLGRNDDVTRIVRTTLVGAQEAPEARLLFSAQRCSGPSAALLYGTASHSQDYDDVGLVGIQPTHPSASIAPAIFAEADHLRRNGEEMICAYAAAFEVWGELASRDRDPVHTKGWHPTGTFGAIAAAAAAASLWRLTPAQATTAISLAASMASGLLANFGSMTKPYHAGRAGQSGVIAARLAAAGMTSDPDAVDSPLGFLAAVSPQGHVDRESKAQFGQRWFIETSGLGFKLFPMCYGAHRALDGMLSLMAKTPFRAEDVERIEVEANRTQFTNLVHTDPQNVLDAKFSMEFAMACIVVAGRCTRAEFEPGFVHRADVRSIVARTKRVYIDSQGYSGDGVIVYLKDGRRLEERFTFPLGHFKRPAPPQAMWTKFEDCVSGTLAPGDDRRLFDALQSLDTLASLDDLPVATSLAPA